MSHTNTSDDNREQYHSSIIGDVLLHSETKLIPIQIISQSLITSLSPSAYIPNIPRIIPNSSAVTTINPTKILCDLKNASIIRLKHKQAFMSPSSKKIFGTHNKVGWTLPRTFKSRTIFTK